MINIISYLIRKKIPFLGGLFWRLRTYYLPIAAIIKPLNSDYSLHITPHTYMGSQLFFNKIWEDKVTNFVTQLQPKSLIIDIGAHIGYYTNIFSNILNPSGKIIAFEPSDIARALLVKNVNIIDKVIQIEKCALSNTYGTTYLKGDQVVEVDNPHDQIIEEITLDSYASNNKLKNIDLIKIDIEGFEMKALLGMEVILKTSYPELIIEVHDELIKRTGYSKAELLEYLASLGYRNKLLSSEPGNCTYFFYKKM